MKQNLPVLLFASDTFNEALQNFGNSLVKSSSCKKLLGVKSSFYDELLLNIGSASVHHRNIQNIAIKMFKVKSHLLPEIVAAYFWSKHKLIIMASQ